MTFTDDPFALSVSLIKFTYDVTFFVDYLDPQAHPAGFGSWRLKGGIPDENAKNDAKIVLQVLLWWL